MVVVLPTRVMTEFFVFFRSSLMCYDGAICRVVQMAGQLGSDPGYLGSNPSPAT